MKNKQIDQLDRIIEMETLMAPKTTLGIALTNLELKPIINNRERLKTEHRILLCKYHDLKYEY